MKCIFALLFLYAFLRSGLPSGVFLKRHRVPKSSSEFFTIDDLAIGADLNIYGRIFHVYDSDPFTRAFYKSLGVDLAEAEEMPLDAYTAKTSKPKKAFHGKLHHPLKTFMEAVLGKEVGFSVPRVKQFLEMDRKVLRFYTIWNDPTLYGEARPYIMHYYLSDDAVEVLEVAAPNSGRDAFSSMLKKQRLPKNFQGVAADGPTPLADSDYYTITDFFVGATINVFGRELFIYAVDEYTKEYFKTVHGHSDAHFPDIKVEQTKKAVPKAPIPPPTGYGNDEDSMGSVYNLVPKPPKIDFAKRDANKGKVLRFVVRMITTKPEDVARRFNMSFFLEDDTIKIQEVNQRNSGFWGGKFLERIELKNAATGMKFQKEDFATGKIMEINSFMFELLESDPWTKRLLGERTY